MLKEIKLNVSFMKNDSRFFCSPLQFLFKSLYNFRFLFFLFSIQFLTLKFCLAQTPIGLIEGLMGNSGVAFSSSTAPSVYNPSLLNQKEKDAYSLSASTFDRLSSKDSGTEISSGSINPGYLSSILVGEKFNHEFYLLSLSPSILYLKSQASVSDGTTQLEGNVDNSNYLLGYTLALRQTPLAFSFFAFYGESITFINSEYFYSNSSVRKITVTHEQVKDLDIGTSISSHHTWANYTLGMQYKTRTIRIYDQRSARKDIYIHGSPTASDFSKTEEVYQPSSNFSHGDSISIGHSFKSKNHEILTDTVLNENSDLNFKYTGFQTFGLKVGTEEGKQFLCGLRQQLGSEIKYFGQATYYSIGFSWITRGLRSSLGAYYYQNIVDQDVKKMGFSYASEFAY